MKVFLSRLLVSLLYYTISNVHSLKHEKPKTISKRPTNIIYESRKVVSSAVIIGIMTTIPTDFSHAAQFTLSLPSGLESSKSTVWERSRQKRTAAVKQLADKGIIKLETDDSGIQFLSLPWIPDRKVPYKKLSIPQRLQNEVCAGAFGEFCKDLILHPVDTLKTRRQAKKKASLATSSNNTTTTTSLTSESTTTVTNMNTNTISVDTEFSMNPIELVNKFKNLYSGFPVVMTASIPQGGFFFLIKKGLLESFNLYLPVFPEVFKNIISISFAVMGYWSFRTPAEIIKTQVQTGQAPSVKISFENIVKENDNRYTKLWKYFPVMMYLDIPFQVMNFILYGFISNAVNEAGYDTTTWTRLFCGVVSGMFCAGVTCPIDVCKTRIIARDKENVQKMNIWKDDVARIQLANNALYNTIQSSSSEVGEGKGEGESNIYIMKFDTTNTPLYNDTTSILTAASKEVLSTGNTQSSSLSTSPSIVNDETVTKLPLPPPPVLNTNSDVIKELIKIYQEEGWTTLFLGLQQRLLYTGLANGIRLAAYGTSRMDLMMRSFDDI